MKSIVVIASMILASVVYAQGFHTNCKNYYPDCEQSTNQQSSSRSDVIEQLKAFRKKEDEAHKHGVVTDYDELYRQS